uniref:Uncharacterized protein n=1 Tax=Anopheles culicifacies TaxID=139723 RepID=A0A182M027_9DIPT
MGFGPEISTSPILVALLVCIHADPIYHWLVVVVLAGTIHNRRVWGGTILPEIPSCSKKNRTRKLVQTMALPVHEDGIELLPLIGNHLHNSIRRAGRMRGRKSSFRSWEEERENNIIRNPDCYLCWLVVRRAVSGAVVALRISTQKGVQRCSATVK